jgi:RNA-directed DNA polymerase
VFVGFVPAVSDDARKQLGREIRRWRLHLRSGTTLADLARSINVIVQGWINYYGRFYRSELVRLLRRINEYPCSLGPLEIQAAAQLPRQGAQVPR